MENPFNYSNVVTGSSFCNRKKEQADLLEFIKTSQNVLLYSHRRTGKSSLIKQIFLNIKQKTHRVSNPLGQSVYQSKENFKACAD